MILIGSNAFQRQWSEIGPDVLAAVSEVGASGWYILGQQVREFEKMLAELCGRGYAVGCANGLDAIEIGLRSLQIQPGDVVLTTPMSAYATTLAIHRAGGLPVFVDVDASGCLDLELVEACLQAHPEIRYCVPVHLYGHCLDLDELARLRDQYGVRILEDGAQAVGAGWGERRVGDVGEMLATSFYPTKNLGALGDGGAVLTDDAELAARAKVLSDYGQTAKYEHSVLGLNSRLDELQAAILARAMVPRLAAWTERRREIAQRYLSGIDHPGLQPLPIPRLSRSVWHLFPVLVTEGRRAEFLAYLRAQGVLANIHYPIAIPDQPAQRASEDRGWTFGELRRARELAAGEVSLPIFPQLTDSEVDRVVEVIQQWRPQ